MSRVEIVAFDERYHAQGGRSKLTPALRRTVALRVKDCLGVRLLSLTETDSTIRSAGLPVTSKV